MPEKLHFTWSPFGEFARNLKKCCKYNSEADRYSSTISCKDNEGKKDHCNDYRQRDCYFSKNLFFNIGESTIFRINGAMDNDKCKR